MRNWGGGVVGESGVHTGSALPSQDNGREGVGH